MSFANLFFTKYNQNITVFKIAIKFLALIHNIVCKNTNIIFSSYVYNQHLNLKYCYYDGNVKLSIQNTCNTFISVHVFQ